MGRFGASQLGLSQGGAVDLHVYCWANRLLDNDMDAPVLEILLGACSFKAHSDSLMAIAGAQMNATLDGVSIKNWSGFFSAKASHSIIEVPQTVTSKFIPSYLDHIEVRVIPSYQYEKFSGNAIASFFNQTFTITNQSDRMGIRLSGPAIECDLKGRH